MLLFLQPPKPHSSHLDPFPAIQLWPHIQIKAHLSPPALLILPRIEVDDILDFSPTPIHNPIMSIERRLVAYERIEASARREGT